MRTEWRTLSVGPTASLRDALAAIDRGRLGIALICGPDDRLLGTLTDGDLRRAILRGVSLESTVEMVMNTNCATAGPDLTTSGVLDLMRSRSIRQVPVIDRAGHLIGLYSLPDLIEPPVRPNWAIIMAGGEGRRLRPLTETVPKPMLPVGNRPLLENTVSLLVQHGFQRLFISVFYLSDQIEAHFGDGTNFGCQIEYLREAEPSGTAGALGLLPDRPTDPLLVINGDLLTDVDLSMLLDYHAEAGCVATQCVREYVFQVPFGVVQCEGGLVVALEEKPLQRTLINAGIYVLSPELLDLVSARRSVGMPDLLLEAIRNGGRVAAFPIRERWTDIGHIEDYSWARQNWIAGSTE